MSIVTFFSRHFVLETASLYVVLTVQEDQTGLKLADPTASNLLSTGIKVITPGSIRDFLKSQ